MNSPAYPHDHDDPPEPIEAYCVHCRQTVEIQDPQPVWTRRGQPATRGECPDCGAVVFRMGRTDAHAGGVRPSAPEPGQPSRARLAPDTLYLNFADDDAVMADQLADDLRRAGMTLWMHEDTETDVRWASGVHPALKSCARMIVLYSGGAARSEHVEAAWRYFRQHNRRVIVVHLEAVTVPDELRRCPRFDLGQDYRQAFRRLLQELSR